MGIPETGLLPGFRILRKIGEGGSAFVYAAEREGDFLPVALKVFKKEAVDSADLSRRISVEMKSYESLRHANLIEVLEVITQPHSALVLELVDGGTLADLQGRLPYLLPEVSVRILIEALRGIEHAHEAGVIHRDLKPSNILITRAGRVLVADFGLAKIIGADVATKTGAILGSPQYMSPEQARGDIVGPASDLFSLTSILYFLVTGTPPFHGDSTLGVLATVIEGRIEPARQRNPKISWELARILERGFAKNASDRYRSAREYRETLEEYLRSLGLAETDLRLEGFLENASGETLRAMNTIAERLALRCEKSIRAGNRESSLELLAHLSLVAPNSQRIRELTGELESAKKKSRLLPFVAALVLAVASGMYIHSRRPLGAGGTIAAAPLAVMRPSPVPSPSLARVEITPTPREKPVASAAAPMRAKLEDKPLPLPALAPKSSPNRYVHTEIVNIDLPKGFELEWDGQEIPPSQRSFRAPIGDHSVTLRVGKQTFRQIVSVVRGEPTEIHVNPPAGNEASDDEGETP